MTHDRLTVRKETQTKEKHIAKLVVSGMTSRFKHFIVFPFVGIGMLHLVFSPTTPVAGQHVLHLLLGGGKRLNEFHFCDDPIRPFGFSNAS